MNLPRIAAVAHKEWRELRRDRIFASLALIMPVLLMIVFGYGLSQDVENVPFAILDLDRSASSRELAHRFIGSRYFDFKGYLQHERQIASLLADGKVRAAIIIPEHFERLLLSGRPAPVQTILDGAFIISARTTRGYVDAIIASASAKVQVEYVSARTGLPPERAASAMQPVGVEIRYLYNQEVRTLWAVAPALIMFILSLVAPLLSALGVVRERETGSIYNIYSTTITRAEYLAGKLLPYVIISFVNALALWLLAVYLFGAPFKGSVTAFMLASLFYVITCTGVGMLLSLVSRTQSAALIITILATMIVVGQYSGMFTPVQSLKGASAVIARMLPPMYYHEVIEGTFLKGKGFADLWSHVLISGGFAVLALAAGWARFHKRART